MSETKRCLYCGTPLKRKTKYRESAKQFDKRRFCSNKCARYYRLGNWDAEIETVIQYQYRCEFCGEDRPHMFINTNIGVLCGVCWAVPVKEEFVSLTFEEVER